MDIHRAYKVLGLHPGATNEEIRAAYRDLAQVWHPDRFEHSGRLQAKAQRNLKRITEAYQVLKDYEPPAEGLAPQSLLNMTYSAVLDLGDILQSGVVERPKNRSKVRRSDVVLGLGKIEATGVMKVRRRRSRKRWLVPITILLAVVLATAALLLLA